MQTKTSDLATILEALPDLSRADQMLIERSYERARQAHEGQFRKSGEPYIRHCLAVAQILADMNLAGRQSPPPCSMTWSKIPRHPGRHRGGVREKIADQVAESPAEELPPASKGCTAAGGDREMNICAEMFLRWSPTSSSADQARRPAANKRTLLHVAGEQQHTAARALDISPDRQRLGIWQIKCSLEDCRFPLSRRKATARSAGSCTSAAPTRE